MITLEQVLKAYEYANSHPHKYLRGTTNWCAAVAHILNEQKPVFESQYASMTQAQAQAQSVSDGVDEILHGKPAAQHQGEPVALTEVEVSQFLSDALTAAGMVRHGKQDKKFAELLADGCVRVRSAWRAEPPATVAVVMPDLKPDFEAWWESDGQYCRAGGGSYEKTFAYRAYEAALAEVARLNGVKP